MDEVLAESSDRLHPIRFLEEKSIENIYIYFLVSGRYFTELRACHSAGPFVSFRIRIAVYMLRLHKQTHNINAMYSGHVVCQNTVFFKLNNLKVCRPNLFYRNDKSIYIKSKVLCSRSETSVDYIIS